MIGPIRARRLITLCAACALAATALTAQDPRAGSHRGVRREAPRFATTRVAPDAYGTTDYTVTTISATSLVPFDPDDTYDTTPCCLSRGFLDGQGELYASVNIPAGAIVDFIGLESDSTCEGIVGLELWEQTHALTSGIAGISSSVHYIEALAASDVTGGRGNGNYCPDSFVTRGRMAVFLSKALGLHWPY